MKFLNNRAIEDLVGQDCKEIEHRLADAVGEFSRQFPPASIQLKPPSQYQPSQGKGWGSTRIWQFAVRVPSFQAEWEIAVPVLENRKLSGFPQLPWENVGGQNGFQIKHFFPDSSSAHLNFCLAGFFCQEQRNFFIHRNDHFREVQQFFRQWLGREKSLSDGFGA